MEDGEGSGGRTIRETPWALTLAVLLVGAGTSLVGPTSLAEPSDADGDDVDDAIEVKVCSTETVRSLFNEMEGDAGYCETDTDYVPEATVLVRVPEATSVGADGDGDGFPKYVGWTFDTVEIDRENGVSWVSDETTVELSIDEAPYGDDADPRWPSGVTIVCRPANHVAAVAHLDDADGDAIPGEVRTGGSEACVDRRLDDPELIQASATHRASVDPDDGDPDRPGTGGAETAPFVTGYEVADDADGDTLAGHVSLRETVYRLDRQDPLDLRLVSSWRDHELDPDDTDPEEPMSLQAFDEDGDHVYDTVEPHLCLAQDRDIRGDGSCLVVEYHPTELYQLVTQQTIGNE